MVSGTRPVFLERSRERGATLFVVMLVIVLLMGIAAMAARSAHLATTASGSERQYTQARYVAEYGLMFANAKLSNGGAQAYLSAMRTPPNTELCAGQIATTAGRSCYRMMLAAAPAGAERAGVQRLPDGGGRATREPRALRRTVRFRRRALGHQRRLHDAGGHLER